MKSPQDAALQRAQDYARDRGWRQEPLTWEEVEVLVMAMNAADVTTEITSDESYHNGYDDGYAEAKSDALLELDREDVLDWCADHGYKLVKEQAS